MSNHKGSPSLKHSLIRLLDATVIIWILVGAIAGFSWGWEIGGGLYVPLFGLIGAFVALIPTSYYIVLSSTRDVALGTLEIQKDQLETSKKIHAALNMANEIADRSLRQADSKV